MPFKLHFIGLLILSGSFLITAPVPPPAAPVLISPANGALMDNGCKPKAEGIIWDFDWSDVPGATAYHIKVFRNPNIPLINQVNVQQSSYHYVSAPSDHIINSNTNLWRWMVRARGPGGWSRWSAARAFRVEKLNSDCP